MAVQTQSLLTDAVHLASQLREQADSLVAIRTWLTYLMILVFGAYFLANGFTTERRVLRSIGRLQAGAAIVGSGNLDHTIPVGHPDEIGELSQAFNLMAANLKGLTGRLAYQAAILQQVNDAVVATDGDNRISAYNRGAEDLYGWQADEVMGLSPDEALPGEFVGGSREQVYAELDRRGQWRGEAIIQQKDGARLHADVRAVQLRDEAGAVVGHIWTSRDITDRKRAEDALAASRAELQAYTRKLVEAVENERRVIARELHDEAGQALTALKLSLGVIQKDPDCPPAVSAQLGELKQVADRVMDDLRKLASDLRPGALDRAGLVPALQQLVAQFGERTRLEAQFLATGMEGRLPSEVETNLFRIAQEALTNIARYAGATRAGVLIEMCNDEVVLVVEDDGSGFDLEEAGRKGHLGLLGMRERAETIGGTLAIETGPGRGTAVYVRVPVAGSSAQPATGNEPEWADRPAAIAGTTRAAGDTQVSAVGADTASPMSDVAAGQMSIHEATTRILESALVADSEEELGGLILTIAERVTGSKFGFIGEINAHGRLDDIAISDPGWEQCRITDAMAHHIVPGGFEIRGLYGRVLASGEAFFTNEPALHPNRIGSPAGHPPLTAFLGVPLKRGDTTVGMIGLGNRAGGYRPEDQQAIEALARVIVEALERKRAEAQIKRLNSELEVRAAEQDAIISAIADGLVVYDSGGSIKRMNRMAEELLGADPAGIVAVHGDGSPYAVDEYPTARALHGEPVRNVELIMRLPGRSEGDSWVSVSSGPIHGVDGTVSGAVTTFTDVNEVHRLNGEIGKANEQLRLQADELLRSEAALKASAEELERRVEERTAALAVATAELAAANRSLQDTTQAFRALSRRLVVSQERERRYVADQLFNEINQVLAALKIHLSFRGEDEDPVVHLAEAQRQLDQVMRDMHHLAARLRPATLDRLGLLGALEQYVAEWGRENTPQVRFSAPNLRRVRLGDEVETAVFRVVQEALMNVAMHADARFVAVKVSRADGRLAVSIEDDGNGFDPAVALASEATGLLDMRERAESAGGYVAIDSVPGEGTRVVVSVPDCSAPGK